MFMKIEKKATKHHPIKPWMTDDLLKCCLHKDKLYIKYKICPTEVNKDKNTSYRNYFKKIKIKTEKLYDEYEFIKYTDDVGHGGALVETTPFDRRVVGSNPALAAM